MKKPITAFKHGVWNAHCGDLPRYRGNACPNWAILNEEREVCLSIHEMKSGELDSGDIIDKKYFELQRDTYIKEIYAWMDKVIPDLFLENLLKLNNGCLSKTPQSTDKNHILRCYPRKPEDSKINWHESSSEEIYKLIRASSHPFSGAFCFLEKHKIIIWEALPVEHEGGYLAVPGQVLCSLNGDPVVACRDEVLLIKNATCDSKEDAKPLILKSYRNRLI